MITYSNYSERGIWAGNLSLIGLDYNFIWGIHEGKFEIEILEDRNYVKLDVCNKNTQTQLIHY